MHMHSAHIHVYIYTIILYMTHMRASSNESKYTYVIVWCKRMVMNDIMVYWHNTMPVLITWLNIDAIFTYRILWNEYEYPDLISAEKSESL